MVRATGRRSSNADHRCDRASLVAVDASTNILAKSHRPPAAQPHDRPSRARINLQSAYLCGGGARMVISRAHPFLVRGRVGR